MDGFPAGAEGDSYAPADDLLWRVMHALAQEDGIGMALVGADLRVTYSSLNPEHFRGLAASPGHRIEDLVPKGEAPAVTAKLQRVLSTGRPLLSYRQRMSPSGELVVSLSVLPLPDDHGARTGLALVFVNVSRETRRLDLMFNAAATIGATLDVTETARQLADSLVPALGDQATVFLATNVFTGEEPPSASTRGGDLGMRCAALAPADGIYPPEFIRPGMDLPPLPDTPMVRRYQRRESLLLPDAKAIAAGLNGDQELMAALVLPKATSSIMASLLARGLILGAVSVSRTAQSPPLREDDLRLLEEIVSRAALSIDNARRYTREHTSSVMLQRSLLPESSTDTATVEAAGVYLPATVGGQGVGGDWYDVVPLSSLRVALVVGDVVGHGLRATATMARLRTAVQALTDLDLGPDDLLAHLDDLVLRIVGSAEPGHEDALASTCLYAVYDPVEGRCAVASAGHPPPAIIHPDGRAEFVTLDPGPPLGIGGLPFEVTEIDVEPGSILALYTDGLVQHSPAHDIGVGMESLRAQLAALPPNSDLRTTAAQLIDANTPTELTDDVTLLLARVRTAAVTDVVSWDIPADPAAVNSARELATSQLATWELDDLAFITELIVSELVTNAIRYAGSPITLRLIRDTHDSVLTCEVSDPSNTQPRLRQARSTDEGGRGLFLVAQLATRWGSRYNKTGKTIWSEMSFANGGGTN